MARKKKTGTRRARRPRGGFSGSIGLTDGDHVLDTGFGPRKEALKPEQIGGVPRFEHDADTQPVRGGGARRGEALQVSEEEDDFEDGRSSAGLTSRSQEDQWARGDVGSRAVDTPSGYLSVEGGEGEEPGPVEPKSVDLPQRRAVRRDRRRAARQKPFRRPSAVRHGTSRRAPL